LGHDGNLSSYFKNRINDDTKEALEMALVTNNNSSLNIETTRCTIAMGMKPTALPCTTEHTQTSQTIMMMIKVGEIELVSAPA
jgi:hypothetical protein